MNEEVMRVTLRKEELCVRKLKNSKYFMPSSQPSHPLHRPITLPNTSVICLEPQTHTCFFRTCLCRKCSNKLLVSY